MVVHTDFPLATLSEGKWLCQQTPGLWQPSVKVKDIYTHTDGTGRKMGWGGWEGRGGRREGLHVCQAACHKRS